MQWFSTLLGGTARPAPRLALHERISFKASLSNAIDQPHREADPASQLEGCIKRGNFYTLHSGGFSRGSTQLVRANAFIRTLTGRPIELVLQVD